MLNPTLNDNYVLEASTIFGSDKKTCTTVIEIKLSDRNPNKAFVSPNVACTNLEIKIDEEIDSIVIFNESGRLVQNESTPCFSIEKMASGIYSANVQTKIGVARFSFVKK